MENKKLIQIHISIIVMVVSMLVLFKIFLKGYDDLKPILMYGIITLVFIAYKYIRKLNLTELLVDLMLEAKYTDQLKNKLLRYPMILLLLIEKLGIGAFTIYGAIYVIIVRKEILGAIVMLYVGGVLFGIPLRSIILLYNAKKEAMMIKSTDLFKPE